MGAVKSLFNDFPDKRTVFKIPLQSEIAAFIKEKKGWPEGFCTYYAEKFWNNYQAQGWVLSNGNKMKDWKACFNNQWQDLRYEADRKLLDDYKKKTSLTPSEYLNSCLEKFSRDEYKPAKSDVLRIYDYLKSKGLMKLPKHQIDVIIEQSGNDREMGRVLSVKQLFLNMTQHGVRF